MAKVPAVLSGPIVVMDANARQLSLPSSDVYFEDGQIKAQGALYTANQSLFDSYLAHLTVAGGVQPGPEAAIKPVMVITAKQPGSMSNFIRVQFKDLDTGASPKFNVEVDETNTYEGLQPDTVQTVLGTTASNGQQPGLVFVTGGPATALPKAGVYSLALSGNPDASVEIPVNTGAGNAFKVQAKSGGSEGERTSVEIKDVDTVKSTFTLVANWKKATGAKITPNEIASTFDYEIDVAAPPGGALGTPLPSVIHLSGGSNAAASNKSSASVSG